MRLLVAMVAALLGCAASLHINNVPDGYKVKVSLNVYGRRVAGEQK